MGMWSSKGSRVEGVGLKECGEERRALVMGLRCCLREERVSNAFATHKVFQKAPFAISPRNIPTKDKK